MERRALVLRGAVPSGVDGDGSGYGSGSGSGYSGDGSGSGDGDGSGYGYGYSGDGSGSGSGYSGDGSGIMRAIARAQLPEKYATDRRTLALWKSDADGRPANGGAEVRSAHPGFKQESPGPLVLCQNGVLHATLRPSKWKGERLWIVALDGEVVGNAEKMGALKREIIAEVKL